MREVNFSIPSANKASVGITTALYDRRALDCTSTLPLINSLNHLAYLTTSSARIREILTLDGGVERLVAILKNGRSKDVMDTWKWNLAFQCVVNIGVRGSDGKGSDSHCSENIRRRVVEADIVPVITTVLDNYMAAIEKLKADHEEQETRRDESKKDARCPMARRFQRRSSGRAASMPAATTPPPPPPQPSETLRTDRRREAPPPISIPPPPQRSMTPASNDAGEGSSHGDSHLVLTPTSDTDAPDALGSHRHHSSIASRIEITEDPEPTPTPGHSRDVSRSDIPAPLATSTWTPLETSFPRSRDMHLFPPGSANSHGDSLSTPLPFHGPRRTSRSEERPPIAHRLSGSGDSDDGRNGSMQLAESDNEPHAREPVIGIRDEINIGEPNEHTTVEQDDDIATTNVNEEGGVETFSITHRGMDGSLIDPNANANNPEGRMSPAEAAFGPTPEAPGMQPTFYDRFAQQQHPTSPTILNSVPRDEDVVMALQLLAYVSKYCDLRSHFQGTHLVPKLRIKRDLEDMEAALNGGEITPTAKQSSAEEQDENEWEFTLPDDYNIFPLVEKFTVRHNTPEMKYWACVVMRNLCRKDKSRGDIRQCAYYKCGKWEDYARQFAKCRRCRQTKYCSKECQKSAWILHRFWCHASAAQ